jgi:diguanylate cyclase (GGDEF)-like protein/PAS domain S-box-containing protein
MLRARHPLTRNYLLALSLIALLVGAVTIELAQFVAAQRENAVIVNVSGRQRMLSQRIVLLSLRLVATPAAEREAVRSDLHSAVELMEQSHNGLLAGDPALRLPGAPSPDVRALYFDAPADVDQQVNAYLTRARTLLAAPDATLTLDNPDLRYLQLVGPTTLLEALDSVVRQYEHESTQALIGIQRMVFIASGSVLLLLVLTGVLIFRPMVRSVARETKHLRDTQQRLAAVLDTAGEAIITLDADGAIERINQEGQRIWGYDSAELIGARLDMLLVAPPPLDTLLREAQPPNRSERQGRRKDGAVFEIELRLTQTPAPDRMTIVAARDITRRQRAEAALKRERDFTAAVLDTAGSLILVVDHHGRIVRFNTACERVTGYRADEVYGQFFADLFLIPEERPGVEAVFAELQAGMFPNAYENVWLTRSGEQRVISWANTALLGSNGQPEYIIGTGIDVTERHRAEADARAVSAQLNANLAELQARTHELAQLNEMSEMLQACVSVDEAYSVIETWLRRLFFNAHGALAVANNSQNQVEVVAAWGVPTGEPVFAPDACWGLRRGHLHVVNGADHALHCTHMHVDPLSSYMCIPLSARGERLGVLGITIPEARMPDAQQRLARTVARALELVLSNLKLRETLRHQSIRDALTGLFNRRYMEETLEREIRRAARAGHTLGVIMLDIDHFKRFNDTFGHSAGDTLLATVGALLRTQVRGEDITCRYGGEEFTLILPDISPEHLQMRAEQLRRAIAELQIEHRQRPLGPVTASLGLALYPSHGLDPAALIEQADAALYTAKQRGRNRVVLIGAPDGAVIDAIVES